MRKRSSILGLLSGAIFLWSCGDAPAPAPEPTPAPVPAKATKVIEEAAEEKVEPEEIYTYSPVGKRDPFRPYAIARPIVEAIVDPNCGALCTWEVDQLRLVAVVSGVANPVGMLEDPRGSGHIVHRGASIGKRSGKITEIRRDRIVVTEYLQGADGQVIPTKTEVMIRARGAEKEQQIVDLTPQGAHE